MVNISLAHLVASRAHSLGVKGGDRVRPRGPRALIYHSVLPKGMHSGGLYEHAYEVFVEQITLMAMLSNESGYSETSSNRSDEPRNDFFVTFDDGYESLLTVVAPAMENWRGVWAAFVCGGYIKEGCPGYLSEPQLRELATSSNVIIGSHGMTHRPLSHLSDSEVRHELLSSMAYLEDIVQKRISYISYPHGSYDARVIAIAEDVGYNAGFTSNFGVLSTSEFGFTENRTSILSVDSLKTFTSKICGRWDIFGQFQKFKSLL